MSIHREIQQAAKELSRPVYFVVGDAGELVRAALKILEDAAVQRCGIPAFNHWSGSVADGGVQAALSTANTVPMMADLRVVVLRDIHLGSDEDLGRLFAYMEHPADSTVLLLSANKFPAVKKGGTQWNRKLQKQAQASGRVFSYRSSQIRIQNFAINHARGLGKSIGYREADVLVSAVGQDFSTVAREIEKLALYVGERDSITGRDVGEACAVLAEEGLWELTSGLAEANSERALRALHRRLEEGVAPHQLMGQVGWQIRLLLSAKQDLLAGLSDSVIKKKHRLRGPTIHSLRGPSGDRFAGPAEVIERLARANRSMNAHRAGGRRVLESLILELCCAS